MLARVATLNLLHGVSLSTGAAAEADLRNGAKLLDADIAGLQEIDRSQDRSLGVDQMAVVAEELRAPFWRFVPSLHGTPGPGQRWRPAEGLMASPPDGPSYGIGLASRWPVRDWQVRRFRAAPIGLPLLVPSPTRNRYVLIPDEPRIALLAVVEAPTRPITVVTTHLSFVPGFNVSQLARIARWARRWPAPRLMLGDLNLPGSAPELVTGWTRLASTATYPSYRPRVQFDHVLGSGISELSVLDFRVLRLPVSDHCALSVDLEL